MKTNKIFSLIVLTALMICGFAPATVSAGVTQANDQNFSQITSSGVAVVDFYADWCGPCKRLAPTFSKLSGEMSNVTFVKVDIDNARQVAKQYNISSIPAIIVLKDGKEVRRNVGALEANALKSMIQSAQ